MRAGALLLASCVIVSGCVPARGGWDVAALGQREAVLDRHSGQRLSDVLPHLQPDAEGAALFLCRWSTDAPIVVSLPPDATPAEHDVMQRALRAWEEAGLGLLFEEAPRAAQLEIRFADQARDGWAPSGAGDTIADCAISGDFGASPRLDRVPAQLAFASIYLKRSVVDELGRVRSLESAELLGALLHELGHALGFAGHVAAGRSVMSMAPESARRHGRSVLEGESLRDATLAALYALPSGVVVGRITLTHEQSRLLERLGMSARERGWSGPWSRVGDDTARLLWRAPEGAGAALELVDWPAGLRAGRVGGFEPNARARSVLRATSTEGPR